MYTHREKESLSLMTMDRDKERETELESAMYTNCLLLGLDPSIIGAGANTTTPRVGLFRHSNPKLGEHLLYFILSSLRGPKDFDKVWPIFDSTQSRDFRKVVQSIISELESQGALPKSNSRVSSLATCCGPRFVELLWQLSLHALREVHRRTFAADVASNPLPASLTDVAFSHAATLLPVTKARISLERRRFLKNAETAVRRQAMWSNLAHEMTAEYRGLCAEEAYLQQELEKLHDLRNKVKLEGEPWDELVSTSSQNSHLVQRATRLWDSLLSRKSQHEVLASGPIEDLIAHREHRYRISGSSLLAAMDESSIQVSSRCLEKEQSHGSQKKSNRENVKESMNSSDEKSDRSGRGQPAVDIAEVLRRWTHALQRIHKQSLHLANSNDGEGPDLLRRATNGGTSGHAESLAATLAEHQQHLASIQVLVNQLKGVAPVIQSSVSELNEEVNSLTTNFPQVTNHHGRTSFHVQPQSTGRTTESSSDEVSDVTSRLSSVHIDKVSSSHALKLPPLFSLTPTAKTGNFNNRQSQVHTNHPGDVYEKLPQDRTLSTNQVNTAETDNESDYILNLKKSVRQAALSSSTGQLQDNQSDDGSEHFFVAFSGREKKPASLRSEQLFASELNGLSVKNYILDEIKYNESLETESDGYMAAAAAAALKYEDSEGRLSFYDMDETHDHAFSPPFLMDLSLSAESFEDLLAPLSETETALMEY